MGFRPKTVRGHDLGECASALQKSIRRNLPDLAGYFALEMYHSGFQKYTWKRLLTVSAEDCHGIITQEINALKSAWEFINNGKTVKDPKGRIFLSKAVLLLCAHNKNRDPDHLQNFIYDKMEIGEQKVLEFLGAIEESERIEVPDFAFDTHTAKGRRMGRSKTDFFRDEQKALSPKQPGLFEEMAFKTH